MVINFRLFPYNYDSQLLGDHWVITYDIYILNLLYIYLFIYLYLYLIIFVNWSYPDLIFDIF